jgi:pyrroloquinoline quinone biosynthesis protein B
MKTFSAIFLILACISCQQTERNQSNGDLRDLPGQPFIVVLGTAQDGGIPHAGCMKACCRERWGHPEKKLRVACIGIVDPVSKACWMVDATPDFPGQLHDLLSANPGHGQNTLKGIFLTHGHIGHYTGLMYLGREAMGASEVPVYAAPRMSEFLENNGPWDMLVGLKNIAIKTILPGQPVILNDRLKVTAIPVPHRGEYTETLALQISSGKKSALYIPDIDRWEDWDLDIAGQVRDHDYVIMDGTFYSGEELPGRDMSKIPHPTVIHTMEQLDHIPVSDRSKVYFTHFNHTNPVVQTDGDAHRNVVDSGFNVCYEGQIIPL